MIYTRESIIAIVKEICRNMPENSWIILEGWAIDLIYDNDTPMPFRNQLVIGASSLELVDTDCATRNRASFVLDITPYSLTFNIINRLEIKVLKADISKLSIVNIDGVNVPDKYKHPTKMHINKRYNKKYKHKCGDNNMIGGYGVYNPISDK